MTHISRRDAFAITAGLGLAGAMATDASPLSAEQLATPTFTLLLVNDIYKMNEENGRGGFARLATIVKAERAKPAPLLYCHAGDTFSPSLMSSFDQAAHIIELLNVAPPDIFVPGNHEFDFGPEIYAARISEAKFKALAANLRNASGELLPRHEDSRMLDLGGIRVGIFGVALATSPVMSKTGDLKFLDEMATVREQVQLLRKAGAEILICACHTDFARDLEIMRSRLVDVVLSGHDHDLRLIFYENTVLAESGQEGQYITAIDMHCKVDTGSGKRVVSWEPHFRIIDSAEVTPDPEALAIIQRSEMELANQLDMEIGKTIGALDSRSSTVRAGEAAIGNLIADALRASTEADVAIINSGSIRGNKLYAAGTALTRRDVLTELPFSNTTIMVEMSGADLKSALENGVSIADGRSGRFPQVSNIKLVFDRNRAAGDRILSVEIAGAPLDLAERYKVASASFLLSGGDGYKSFTRSRVLIGATDGKLVANEVMSYIRRAVTIHAAIDSRIVAK